MYTDKQKIAVGVLSMVGSVLSHYERGSMNKAGNKLAKTVRKELKKLGDHRPQEYRRIVREINIMWNAVADKHKGCKFEGMAFTVHLIGTSGIDAERYNITEKMMTAFAQHTMDVILEYEQKSYELVEELIDGMYGVIQVERKKRVDLSALKKKVYNELVLEGKIK